MVNNLLRTWRANLKQETIRPHGGCGGRWSFNGYAGVSYLTTSTRICCPSPLGMGKHRATSFSQNTICAPPAWAVWIDVDGHVGAQDLARLDVATDQVVYCCSRGVQFVLAYRLQLWMQDFPERSDQAAVAAKLEELAVAGGVGLTPHRVPRWPP
jgi:hypothetical protein